MDMFGHFYALGVALALGLLIGLERGWKDRDLDEGERVAGVRTYALIGLLGGVFGLLARAQGSVLLGIAFIALTSVLVTAYILAQKRRPDLGITSLVATLLAFSLGAMATQGHVELATAAAVVTAVLLSIKPQLHGVLEQLERKELYATLKLLLISVVVLPLLPNEGYGPGEVLNPYRIWWYVVLIAGISYLGYFAMKLAGERKGVLATGLFAGLASSTAATVNFARLARKDAADPDLLATGVLVACGTMFPRILAVLAVVERSLALALLWPVAVMGLVSYAAALVLWRRSGTRTGAATEVRNPFELRPALIFAALLAALMLFSQLLADEFGDAGVYLIAAISGLANVDAITLSLANMMGETLALGTAALGILLAAIVNTLVKGGLAYGIGGAALGLRVVPAIAVAVLSGLATWWLAGPAGPPHGLP